MTFHFPFGRLKRSSGMPWRNFATTLARSRGRAPQRAIICAALLLGTARVADAGWVISGFLGAAGTARTYLSLIQPGTATALRFDRVEYEGRSFSLPPYYGYRGGFFFGSNGWFGVEGEVIHMKAYAQIHAIAPATGVLHGAAVASSMPIDSVVERFSLSHGQNMILLNAVVRHVLTRSGDYVTPRFAVVARAGAGPTLPHVESTIGGVGDESYERGAIALQLAAGIEVRLWKRLHALGEYKFTRCRQSVSGAGGSTIETLLNTQHIVFGASWHF